MFRSRERPIVIPQAEHQRLAGALAALWGNADFDAPRVRRASLVAGIGLHDRAYGDLDAWPIGETPDDEWLRLTRRGFDAEWSDPVADLIAKLHLKRLVSWTVSAEHEAMAAEMEDVIRRRVERHGLSREELERIDRITNFCDSVSFAFCFERATRGEVAVFPRNDGDAAKPVRFVVEAGDIRIEPWPLAVEAYAGYLVGYAEQGYPAALDPVIVPYRIARAA